MEGGDEGEATEELIEAEEEADGLGTGDALVLRKSMGLGITGRASWLSFEEDVESWRLMEESEGARLNATPERFFLPE